MAFENAEYHSEFDYTYLSTDTKPTTARGLVHGARALEVDTGKKYVYNASNTTWYLYGGPGSAVSGVVSVDQTTPGTTDAVTPSAPVPLSSAVHTASISAVGPAAANTVTAKFVKASAGNLVRAVFINRNATVRYGQLHNKATIPLATEAPVISLPIPGGSANAPGVLSIELPETFRFTTGIGWAISTTETLFTDAATASEHSVHVWYV